MSLMASLVTTSRMQQCFNLLIDIYHEFMLLFYCCVLLEIKLTTTTKKPHENFTSGVEPIQNQLDCMDGKSLITKPKGA